MMTTWLYATLVLLLRSVCLREQVEAEQISLYSPCFFALICKVQCGSGLSNVTVVQPIVMVASICVVCDGVCL